MCSPPEATSNTARRLPNETHQHDHQKEKTCSTTKLPSLACWTRRRSATRLLALPWRPSRPRAQSGSPAPFEMIFPACCTDFPERWSPSRTPRNSKDASNVDPERPRPSRTPSEARPIPEIPISIRLLTAGSFFGDFRTPSGVRNSSRKQTGRFRAEKAESCRSQSRGTAYGFGAHEAMPYPFTSVDLAKKEPPNHG
jgi:hypothetical protein